MVTASSEEQRRAAEAEARASTLEARTVEQVASALRTTVETERAKLRAALNAVEEANKRAERAEADVSAAQLALAAERNIAAEATASSISDRDRATALHTRLEQATSEMRDAEERARNDRKASVAAAVLPKSPADLPPSLPHDAPIRFRTAIQRICAQVHPARVRVGP